MTEMQNTSDASNMHSEPPIESLILSLDRHLDGGAPLGSEPPSPKDREAPWPPPAPFVDELRRLRKRLNLAAFLARTSPTPELITAGEAAMRELGLTHPTMVSVPLSPWWTTCKPGPATGSREYFAQQAFEFRSNAQVLMAKSNKYRDKKLQIQQDLVWCRDYRRHQKSGADLDNMSLKTRKFDTRPPSLPWGRNLMAWDNQHWTDGPRKNDRRNWKLEWEAKETKKKYRKYWKRMAIYRTISGMAMVSAYVSALEALEASMDHRFWGEYFG
ncbi:hypothetical protein V8F06_014436 [Rhypophila decipiens]